MSEKPLKATVSGSFRRAMAGVEDAVFRLTDAGVGVLSPADPRVVDQFGDFLYVASDRARAIRLVQSRHLAAIEASDFVWVVAPDGYVGQSAAMEIGFAIGAGTPVFSSEVLADLTLRQYVTALARPEDAMRAMRDAKFERQGVTTQSNVLLDPSGVLQAAHDDLEQIADELTRPGQALSRVASDAADGCMATWHGHCGRANQSWLSLMRTRYASGRMDSPSMSSKT